MSSTRLPNKVMHLIGKKPLLQWVVERAEEVNYANKVVYVATSNEPSDDPIEAFCKEHEVKCYRGSLTDVRSRFLAIGAQEQADVLVRYTGDNPLTNPKYTDLLIDYLEQSTTVDYCGMNSDLVPLGTSSEVFKFAPFLKTSAEHTTPDDVEHVTPCLRKSGTIHYLQPPQQYKRYRLTIDTPDDLEFYRQLVKKYTRATINLEEIVHFLDQHPELSAINEHVQQNKI